MVALACTYLTYALMPIRLKDALLAGMILAVVDLVLLATVGQFDMWSHQVRSILCIKNVCVFEMSQNWCVSYCFGSKIGTFSHSL